MGLGAVCRFGVHGLLLRVSSVLASRPGEAFRPGRDAPNQPINRAARCAMIGQPIRTAVLSTVRPTITARVTSQKLVKTFGCALSLCMVLVFAVMMSLHFG